MEAISPKYFDDKKRSFALLSIAELLNILLPESQSYKNIYNSLNNFLGNLNMEIWPYIYIFWELKLIKELGYGFDLEKTSINEDVISVNIDNTLYNIPKFIINDTLPDDYSKTIIYKSLLFTRSLLNKFFIPNSLFFPKSRNVLEKYFLLNTRYLLLTSSEKYETIALDPALFKDIKLSIIASSFKKPLFIPFLIMLYSPRLGKKIPVF